MKLVTKRDSARSLGSGDPTAGQFKQKGEQRAAVEAMESRRLLTAMPGIPLGAGTPGLTQHAASRDAADSSHTVEHAQAFKLAESTVSGNTAMYTITGLGTLPGFAGSLPAGINDSGEVVGLSYNKAGSEEACVFSGSKVTGLGTLPGYAQSTALDVNDSGEVVGSCYGSSGGEEAFTFSNSRMMGLNTSSEAFGVNDSGEVVGSSLGPGGTEQAFIDSNGKITSLGTLPGDAESLARGINDRGEVVGYSSASTSSDNYTQEAFTFSDGKMTGLGTLPGDAYSQAKSINANGQVVGWSYSVAPVPHYEAFMFSNGKMTGLGTLSGYPGSLALGINDSGEVVGQCTGYPSSTAFLFSNSKMTDLNDLIPAHSGWKLIGAEAINNSGQIAGYGYPPFSSGHFEAFLLTPVGKTSPVVTWHAPADITYGTRLTAAQLDATANVPGTFDYTPAAGTLLKAGIDQTLSVVFTPTNTTNYNITTTTVQITVNKAVLTVTANNAARTYGKANPTFTDTIAGFVNGDSPSVVSGSASLTTTATAASPAGKYVIVAGGGTLSAANYSFTFKNGTLTVTPVAAAADDGFDDIVITGAIPKGLASLLADGALIRDKLSRRDPAV